MKIEIIQNKIYEIRGEKVMLDFDIAHLYEVETRVFNQAIKRNIQSFPKDFMFRLTAKEWKEMISQFVISSDLELEMNNNNSSQIVMSSRKHRGEKYLPYVFTEHGVTMVASVLKSPKARKMNIAIVRAFIALKKLAHSNLSAINLLKELRERIDEHDVQLKSIYDALENMLDEKEEEKLQKLKWEKRELIGFKK
jgi:phage regulator Rha-like protein